MGSLRRPSQSQIKRITYLDFLLTKSHTVNNVHTRHLVRLWVSLIFFFENGLIFRTDLQEEKRVNDENKHGVVIRRDQLTSSFYVSDERVVRCRPWEVGS